jgi:hypothetical protein
VAAAASALAASLAVFRAVPGARSITIDVVERSAPAEKIPGHLRVRVKNHSHRPLSLVGMETTCSCMVASGLPLQLMPREQGEFVIQYHAAAAAPLGHVLLWTDWDNLPWWEVDLGQKLEGSRTGRPRSD